MLELYLKYDAISNDIIFYNINIIKNLCYSKLVYNFFST